MKYKVNDAVMFDNSDVCVIEDIRKEKFSSKEQIYYVLKPVYDDRSTYYCPVKNEDIQLRSLMTKDEVKDLIKSMPELEIQWIDNDNERRTHFNELLKHGDHKQMVKLLKTLYANRAKKQREGRKFYAMDERVMKEAEKIVHGEIAYVMGIEIEEVENYISGIIDVD